MPIVAGLVEERGAFQFSLPALFALVAYFALFTAFGKAVGFHWLFLMVPVCTLFGALGAISPRPVVYGSVLAGVLLVTGTLVTCSLAAAREDARRNLCTDNLRQLGLGYQAARQYRPNSQPDIRNWDNEEQILRVEETAAQ